MKNFWFNFFFLFMIIFLILITSYTFFFFFGSSRPSSGAPLIRGGGGLPSPGRTPIAPGIYIIIIMFFSVYFLLCSWLRVLIPTDDYNFDLFITFAMIMCIVSWMFHGYCSMVIVSWLLYFVVFFHGIRWKAVYSKVIIVDAILVFPVVEESPGALSSLPPLVIFSLFIIHLRLSVSYLS